MDGVLYLDEVFLSMQGESSEAGYLCVFVRLYGCNVGCAFCDQPQCKRKATRISIENLVNKIATYKVMNVCITGGEPMLQWNALYPVILELLHEGYKVSIETSGCIPIEFDDYARSFKYVMDVKCPSSGVTHKNILDNLMRLKKNDEVKFVISDHTDYLYARDIIRKYPTQATLLFSPCFKRVFNKRAGRATYVPTVGKQLIEWMITDNLQNVRVQIQMHKILSVR